MGWIALVLFLGFTFGAAVMALFKIIPPEDHLDDLPPVDD